VPAIENVVIYDHWEYFSVIWYNLLPVGIVCGHLVYFSRFGTFVPRKIWQPWSSAASSFGKDSLKNGASHFKK
jgi:hypothetical protein